jgi:hypothetical protein
MRSTTCWTICSCYGTYVYNDPVLELRLRMRIHWTLTCMSRSIYLISTIGLCGLAIILCFYVDNASSRSWQSMDITRLRNSAHMPFECAVFFSIFLVYWTVPEFYNCGLLSILLWCAVGIGSWVLPAALHKISALVAADEGASTANLSSGLLRQCRVSRPLVLGMKYGLLVKLLGVRSCLDAISLYEVAIHCGWQRINIERHKKFREISCLAYLGGRLAVFLWQYYNGEQVSNVIFGCLSALCLVFMVDSFSLPLTALGYWLGEKIHSNAKQTVSLAQRNVNGTARVLQNDTIGLGVLVFAVWVGSLAAIAAV